MKDTTIFRNIGTYQSTGHNFLAALHHQQSCFGGGKNLLHNSTA